MALSKIYKAIGWTLAAAALATTAYLVADLLPGRARAYAPSDQYTVTVETVSDRFTGLTWQRDRATGTDLEATAGCDALFLAGVTDWRLPTSAELATLVDFSVPPDFSSGVVRIDTLAFPTAVAADYWTSTPISTSSDIRVMVNFASGCIQGPVAWPHDTRSYRCVRR